MIEKYFKLLRFSLGIDSELSVGMSPDEWKAVYQLSERQALLGVIFDGIKKLPADQAPPFALLMQWTATAEKIRGMNQKFYAECQRLTKLFKDNGRKTAILKGQANSMLYPNTLSRNPGDIDIYVEGGKESVIKLLDSLGMLSKDDMEMISYHHLHLEQKQNDIEVEVHFRPSSGVFNPFCNKRLQKYLMEEVAKSQLTEYGFYVPSMKFALAMQLAHIQRHCLTEGIGLRQITDYYILLNKCISDDRATTYQMLGKLGMERFAAALMYVLKEIYHLDESLMLCTPDVKRGKLLLDEIVGGGNFGWYRENRPTGNFTRPMERRIHQMKLSTLFPREMHWYYLYSVGNFFAKLPVRIKYRSWSLQSIKK
ncbi:MAG: nucleotidyltransferase family protein [Bacteroidales bacterium]|nr:nucleotidyltransferase family protein [Bacteroidales bacterium]